MRKLTRLLPVMVALLGAAALSPSLLQAQVAAPAASTSASAPPAKPKMKAKVAYVDVERCVGENEDGLRAKAALKKISDRQQMYVSQIEEQLKREQEELGELQKKGDTTLAGRAIAYQDKLQKYNDTIKRINNDLARREDELYAPIETKVKSIFTRIAEERGLDLIVDRKALSILPRAELDLTEQVINEYNWGTPGAPKAAGSTGVTVAPATSGGGGAPTVAPKPSSSAPKPFVAPL